MQASERIVYIMISIIVGAMLIRFIASTAFKEEGFEAKDGFKNIGQDEFAQAALEFWDECAMGEKTMNRTLFVKFSSAYSKAELFKDIKGIDLCRTLQSKELGCGEYEHVVFAASFDKPKLVRLSCDDETHTMVIE